MFVKPAQKKRDENDTKLQRALEREQSKNFSASQYPTFSICPLN